MLSLLIAVVFFAVGILLIFVAYTNRKKAQAAHAWPSVPGQIIESRLVQYEKYDGGADGQQRLTAWQPRIVCQYAVAGRPLQCGLGPSPDTRAFAERMVERYRVGAQAQVYFNPENPAEAMLERPSGSGYIFMYVMAGVFLFISALAMLMAVAAWVLRSKGV